VTAMPAQSLTAIGMLVAALAIPACAPAAQDDVEESAGAATAADSFTLERVRPGAWPPPIENAYWLSHVSAVAYDEPEVASDHLSRIGVDVRGECELVRFEHPKLDAQALLLVHPKAIVVAFRGSESATDWQTNADASFTEARAGGVHTGFYNAFHSLWDDDAGALVDGKPSATGLGATLRSRAAKLRRPVYFTGHSMGGALASLAALEAAQPQSLARSDTGEGKGTPSATRVEGVYTFGAPRVGDRRLATALGSFTLLFFRFVNTLDGVPALPLPGGFHPTPSENESALEVILYDDEIDWSGEGRKRGSYVPPLSSVFLFLGLRLAASVDHHMMALYTRRLDANRARYR